MFRSFTSLGNEKDNINFSTDPIRERMIIGQHLKGGI